MKLFMLIFSIVSCLSDEFCLVVDSAVIDLNISVHIVYSCHSLQFAQKLHTVVASVKKGASNNDTVTHNDHMKFQRIIGKILAYVHMSIIRQFI